MSCAASGTMQCACTSMVLTRLPLTTTWRRLGAGACPEPPPAPTPTSALIVQSTKARRGPVCMVSLIDMSVPFVLYASCNEESDTAKACNAADACPMLRTGVGGRYLPAPRDAHARPQMRTGLLARLAPHCVALLSGDALEVWIGILNDLFYDRSYIAGLEELSISVCT